MAVPVADISAPSNWTTAPLYENLIARRVNIRGKGFGEAVVRFAPVVRASPNHVFEFRVRYRGPAGGRLNCRLYTGTTLVRETLTPVATTEWQEHILTMTKNKSDEFTDLNDIRLGLEPNGPAQILRASLASFGTRYPATPMPPNRDVELFQPMVDKCEALDACIEAVDYLKLKGLQTITAAMTAFRDEPDRITHPEYGSWALWAVKNLKDEPEFDDWLYNVITRVACESITVSDVMIIKMFRVAKDRLPPPAKRRCRDRFRDKLPEMEVPDDYGEAAYPPKGDVALAGLAPVD